MTLHVITGGPLTGKSTFVRESVKQGDLVIDLDQIATALTVVEQSHDYPDYVRQLAINARAAVIASLPRLNLNKVNVWLIHGKPSALQRTQYLRLGAQFHNLTCTTAQLEQRIKTRPLSNQQRIRAYYANQLDADE